MMIANDAEVVDAVLFDGTSSTDVVDLDDNESSDAATPGEALSFLD